MKAIIEELKRDFDYIVIDCPAGIEQGFKNAIAGADQAIVVTTPERSAVRDADRVIGLLEQEPHIQSPRLIVNRIKNNMVKSGDMLHVDEIIDVLAINLLGVVHDDEAVIAASNRGEPIALKPNTQAAMAYRNIGRRILGESVPLMAFNENKGFLKKMKQLLGMR